MEPEGQHGHSSGCNEEHMVLAAWENAHKGPTSHHWRLTGEWSPAAHLRVTCEGRMQSNCWHQLKQTQPETTGLNWEQLLWLFFVKAEINHVWTHAHTSKSTCTHAYIPHTCTLNMHTHTHTSPSCVPGSQQCHDRGAASIAFKQVRDASL